MSYTINPQYQKSVLNAYSTLPQTVASGASLDYDNIDLLTGQSIKYVAGTPGIVITNPGLYFVTVDGTVAASEDEALKTAAATQTPAPTENLITLGIQNNGTMIPGAKTSATSTGEDDDANFSLTTIIRVRPSCCSVDNTARIHVVNTGVPAVYTDASITIYKMC